MDPVQEILLARLTEVGGAHLLCIAPDTPPAIAAWLDQAGGRRVTALSPRRAVAALASMGRFDDALVTGALETLPLAEATALIARLRDVHCHRFAVCYRRPGEEEPQWNDGRFRGLTLALHRRVTGPGGGETSIYTYDIDTYNRRREWNTPENWAHPGNFHRWRW